jgi:hypothetical protein
VEALGLPISSVGSPCLTLIQKARAAIFLDDLHEYAQCLDEGMCLALHIESLKLQHDAWGVFVKAPEAWHKEQMYQQLAELFGSGEA